MRIGLAQMVCEKGAIEQNLATIGQLLDEATEREIDVLALPEMSLTGYIDPGRYPAAVQKLDGAVVRDLLALTRGHNTSILAGLVEKNPAGKPFITQVVVRDGRLLGSYRKRTIEDEEADWFSAGTTVPVFQHDGVTYGLAICADLHSRQVFEAGAVQGAQIIFEMAAPGLYGEQVTRDWGSGFEWWRGACREHLGGYAREFGVWIAVATQAGRTVDEDFPGGGYLFDPSGKRRYATPDWSPGVVYLDVDLLTNQVRILD